MAGVWWMVVGVVLIALGAVGVVGYVANGPWTDAHGLALVTVQAALLLAGCVVVVASLFR